MGPTWVLSPPNGPHVGSMKLAIWDVFFHTELIHRHLGGFVLALMLVTHLFATSSAQHNQHESRVSLVRFKAMVAPGAVLQPENVGCSPRGNPASCAVQCLQSPAECLLFLSDQDHCYLCTLKSHLSTSELLSTTSYFLDKTALLGKPISYR